MRPSTPSAKENLAACVTMLIATTLCVAARMAVQLRRTSKPTGSDWLCLVGTLCFYAYCASIIWWIYRGSSFGAFDVDLKLGLDEATNLLKTIFFTEIMFGIVITTTKLSILWFYHGIFATGVKSGNRWAIRIVAAMCTVWFLVTEPIVIFQCRPIHLVWTAFSAAPTCLNTTQTLMGYELSNFFLDVIILCLPAPMVWQLKLGKGRKVAILSVFLLGSLVCIASIMRLYYIWNQPMNIPNLPKNMIWSTVQLGMAIVCSCLPTLNPIFTALRKPLSLVKSWTSSLGSSSRSRKIDSHGSDTYHGSANQGSYSREGFAMSEANQSKSRAYSKTSSDRSSGDLAYPVSAIHVHRKVEVV